MNPTTPRDTVTSTHSIFPSRPCVEYWRGEDLSALDCFVQEQVAEVIFPILWRHHESTPGELDFSRLWRWVDGARARSLSMELWIPCGPVPGFTRAGYPDFIDGPKVIARDGREHLFFDREGTTEIPSVFNKALIKGFDQFILKFLESYDEQGYRHHEVKLRLVKPMHVHWMNQEKLEHPIPHPLVDFSAESQQAFESFLKTEASVQILAENFWEDEMPRLAALQVNRGMAPWAEAACYKFFHQFSELLLERGSMILESYLEKKPNKGKVLFGGCDEESLLTSVLGFRSVLSTRLELLDEAARQNVELLAQDRATDFSMRDLSFHQVASIAMGVPSNLMMGSSWSKGLDTPAREFFAYLRRYGKYQGRIWKAVVIGSPFFGLHRRQVDPFYGAFEKAIPEGVALASDFSDDRLDQSDLIILSKHFIPEVGDGEIIKKMLMDGKTVVLCKGQSQILQDKLNELYHPSEERVMEFHLGVRYQVIPFKGVQTGSLVVVDEESMDCLDDLSAIQLFASTITGYSCEAPVIRVTEKGLNLYVHDLGPRKEPTPFGRHLGAVLINTTSEPISAGLMLARKCVALGHIASSGTSCKVEAGQGELHIPPRSFIAFELGVYDD